jgi:hypothetical protein
MRKRVVVCVLLAGMTVVSHGARGQNIDRDTSDNGRRYIVAVPNTTSLGRTKPPGRAASQSLELQGKSTSREEIAAKKITNSICIGCDR